MCMCVSCVPGLIVRWWRFGIRLSTVGVPPSNTLVSISISPTDGYDVRWFHRWTFPVFYVCMLEFALYRNCI